MMQLLSNSDSAVTGELIPGTNSLSPSTKSGGEHPSLPDYPTEKDLRFRLPKELEASEPPEARGMARDEIRLMVSARESDRVAHTLFRSLPNYLDEGDLVVLNTSRTINAALEAVRPDGSLLHLHLSTRLPADIWIVELRRPLPDGGTEPFVENITDEHLTLPGGASAVIHRSYVPTDERTPDPDSGRATPVRLRQHRLRMATLRTPLALDDYLEQHGFPIRYGYVKRPWPISCYRTLYGVENGSAEMPSAGRGFTPELITRLVARGIGVAPLLLHTGVASQEEGEPPYEEYFRVPESTARLINITHAAGKRVIAVGTTVVRALESVTDRLGNLHPGEGWTRLVVTPDREIRSVDGLLTGLHESGASHLAMLEAIGGRRQIVRSYREALDHCYLWHEFGDAQLMLRNF